MKNPLALGLLLFAAASAFGTPCWTMLDGCGSSPLCSGYLPPDAVGTTCIHTFCDNGSVCYGDSSQNRMIRSERTIYYWKINNVVYTCVSGQLLYPDNGCCRCNVPGVVTSPATAD